MSNQPLINKVIVVTGAGRGIGRAITIAYARAGALIACAARTKREIDDTVATILASILNVRIYDIKGRCIRTLANCEFAGAKGEIIWDGFDESRQRARIGVYVVYLEATDRSSGRVERAKAVAVVATKL